MRAVVRIRLSLDDFLLMEIGLWPFARRPAISKENNHEETRSTVFKWRVLVLLGDLRSPREPMGNSLGIRAVRDASNIGGYQRHGASGWFAH